MDIDHRQYHHFDHGALHQYNNQHQQSEPALLRMQRKRKADAPPENNERLSKRMSLLNLENSGQKLYVPVENPDSQAAEPTTGVAKPKKSHRARAPADNSVMQLDDSKYKVYIYNLDDELSSCSSDNESDASPSSPDSSGDANGKLVFLHDIDKHLLANRIPTRVLQDPRPDPRAELAGKELVLYSVPTSLSVPAEHDSVRKAIIEARARARERQKAELAVAAAAREGMTPSPTRPPTATTTSSTSASASSSGMSQGAMAMDAEPLIPPPPVPASFPGMEEDPDAMELD
ncbi:hypothetical protein VTJ83DRAFT_2250 [Remersonia thermophila]|uniref:Uncharacterized protein n=1 Tax=Remersonia thermophila TaxID=72144 RepID=A0ABR4DJQ2_9PEZI